MNLRKRIRLSRDERAYIDVVPIVDILLAVFLFLAILAFQSPMTFIAVKLPFAQHGEKGAMSIMKVQVTADGSYRMLGKVVDIKTVENQIKKLKPTSIIIEADERAQHKFVVQLMDVAKKHKIEDLIIATRKRR